MKQLVSQLVEGIWAPAPMVALLPVEIPQALPSSALAAPSHAVVVLHARVAELQPAQALAEAPVVLGHALTAPVQAHALVLLQDVKG